MDKIMEKSIKDEQALYVCKLKRVNQLKKSIN